MTESGMFNAFLAVALALAVLVPMTAPLLAWGKPPHNFVVRFSQRHPFGLSVAQASIWLVLLTMSFAWREPSRMEWVSRALQALLAFEAITRAWRYRQQAVGTSHTPTGRLNGNL